MRTETETPAQILRALADEIESGRIILESINIERRNFAKDAFDATLDISREQFVLESQKIGFTYTIQTRIPQSVGPMIQMPAMEVPDGN